MFCHYILPLLNCHFVYTLNFYTTHTTHTEILQPDRSYSQEHNST
eukprot:UN05449